MYIVAVYDISTIEKSGQRRLNRIMKLFRKYLHHTQKSVFEGELSEAKFFSLKRESEKIINPKEDYIVFYRIDNPRNVDRITVGLDFDPTDNFI
ncbi:CRISPR-associated endonuclease Cas2 [Hippea sp. KM1]|uniref:CRISPR-associated endonuclease Cas2 n=1 Tax=Hippea sp. KM1 TaxID=944481 RepID=UPI00046D3119|nr:CRISPR-associated endonuclease Cas2 [Hippea sp. KM1]